MKALHAAAHPGNGTEQVVLVDRHDRVVGLAEKLEAHRLGVLHRAVSVFVFNTDGQLLLQRRHPEKYHSPGLWSNTACTHPAPGEATRAAAGRRLEEEMGLRCELAYLFGTIYRAGVSAELVEHEYDHIFLGVGDRDPAPNGTEVSEWRWADPAALLQEVATRPQEFTIWFRILLRRVLAVAEGLTMADPDRPCRSRYPISPVIARSPRPNAHL
jgi:isopentenyl-diphosphate Delta-isomerase